MRWEEALAAAKSLNGRSSLIETTLSYHYLNGGPTLLTDRERALRRVISSIPDGGALPADLCRHLVAWEHAVYIAQRRSRWDLPPSWSTPEPEARQKA